MKYTLRRASAATVAAVLTASLLSFATVPAQAAGAPAESGDVSLAASVRFSSEGLGHNGSRGVSVTIDGAFAGSAFWSADPHDGLKGDTLYVEDRRSDGYAITAHVYRAGNQHVASASTSGHTAPYKTSTSNNIAEDQTLTLHVVVTKGSTVHGTSQRYTTYS